MDKAAVIAQVKRDAATATDPVLTDPDVDAVVEETALATVWAPSTPYTVGTRIVPTVRTGYHFQCVQGGTSGTTEPAWPGLTSNGLLLGRVVLGLTLQDGTTVWRLAGTDWDTLYDVRLATYKAWMLKAARASSYAAARFDTESFNEQQIYDHCVAMAAPWAPLGFA